MWLRRGVPAQMAEEAAARFPAESGGVVMGYWSLPDTVVVTRAIGPGPRAAHSEHGFDPDHEWQLEEIALHYTASNRMETYLGDWHSHPGAERAGLSRKDRATLYRIAADPNARAPRALMLVLIGGPDDWKIAAWTGQASRKFLLPRLSLNPMLPKLER